MTKHYRWTIVMIFSSTAFFPITLFLGCVLTPVESNHSRVIRGTNVPEGKYPFMASLQTNGGHFCGGSIITDQAILTAAHCKSYIIPGRTKVYIGGVDIMPNANQELELDVSEVAITDGWSNLNQDEDLAVILLTSKIDFNSTDRRRICIAGPNAEPQKEKCVLAGWGQTADNPGSGARILQEAVVPISDPAGCAEAYGEYDTKQLICAGHHEQSTSCYGDSGGPLFCPVVGGADDEWVQFGIVSFGQKKCIDNAAFYAKVSAFNDWIAAKAEI